MAGENRIKAVSSSKLKLKLKMSLAKGLTVRHIIEEGNDGYPCTSILVDYKKDGRMHTLEIREYIEKEMDDSIHEAIRGNVLLATRFFNHRVKQSSNEIVEETQ